MTKVNMSTFLVFNGFTFSVSHYNYSATRWKYFNYCKRVFLDKIVLVFLFLSCANLAGIFLGALRCVFYDYFWMDIYIPTVPYHCLVIMHLVCNNLSLSPSKIFFLFWKLKLQCGELHAEIQFVVWRWREGVKSRGSCTQVFL